MVDEKSIKASIIEKKTILGSIFLLDANDLNLSISDFDHKRTFEKFLVDSIIQAIYPKAILKKTDSGAPFLENYPAVFLSISHSSSLAVVYFSEKSSIGIDIEMLSRIMIGRSKYFLTPNENIRWEKDNFKLLNAWSAKEAMYKYLKGEVENFKNSIIVEDISEQKIIVSHLGITCEFKVDKLENHLMIYSI